MGDGFDHKKGAATPGRNVPTPQPTGVPGKRTLVELCYEGGPTLDRPFSVVDQPPLGPEEIKRKIAERIEATRRHPDSCEVRRVPGHASRPRPSDGFHARQEMTANGFAE